MPEELPATAAWRHVDARAGFEVLFLQPEPDGYGFRGYSTAVEDGVGWSVRFEIAVDPSWVTRRAHVVADSRQGVCEVRLERDAGGGWRVDAVPAPELDGLMDVDLEASAFTNAFPARRLGLGVGESAAAPSAYVRVPGLEVERLEQTYARLQDDGKHSRYDYAAPSFDFRAELVYDEFGLVLDYPGIAARVV